MSYGKELILDLCECDKLPMDRETLTKFFEDLCTLIDMGREDLHFWDYDGDEEGYAHAEKHLKGTSAIQFIKTSNVTIHTLDELKTVYLNIFSCKSFIEDDVVHFCLDTFGGIVTQWCGIDRG